MGEIHLSRCECGNMKARGATACDRCRGIERTRGGAHPILTQLRKMKHARASAIARELKMDAGEVSAWLERARGRGLVSIAGEPCHLAANNVWKSTGRRARGEV